MKKHKTIRSVIESHVEQYYKLKLERQERRRIRFRSFFTELGWAVLFSAGVAVGALILLALFGGAHYWFTRDKQKNEIRELRDRIERQEYQNVQWITNAIFRYYNK